MRAPGLAFALLLLATSIPLAHGAPALQETRAATGWVAYRVHLDGSPGAYSFTTLGGTTRAFVGAYVYDAADRLAFSGAWHRYDGEVGFVVQTDQAGGVREGTTLDHARAGPVGWRYTFNDPTRDVDNPTFPAGDYLFVFFAVGDVDGWSFEIDGGGAQPFARAESDRVWFHTTEDFAGTLNVEAAPGYPGVANVAASAQVDATLTVHAQGVLIGTLVPWNGYHETWIQDKDGLYPCGSCYFPYLKDSDGPALDGDVQFQVRKGADAWPEGAGQLWLLVLDLTPP